MREFSATELRGYLKTAPAGPLLLDVREPWEFDKARIEGSVLAPMRTIPERLQDFKPDQEIVRVVTEHDGILDVSLSLFAVSGRTLQSNPD